MHQHHNFTTSTGAQLNNWAFIDFQNLVKGALETNHKINWRVFREYLRGRYSVNKAILFLGKIKKNWWFYNKLLAAGFELEFRPVRILASGEVDGGNIDADLAASIMDNKFAYERAVLISNDGDYFNTLKRLQVQNKLLAVISPQPIEKTSALIKRIVRTVDFISIHSIDGILKSA